jgi:hypothetical protein
MIKVTSAFARFSTAASFLALAACGGGGGGAPATNIVTSGGTSSSSGSTTNTSTSSSGNTGSSGTTSTSSSGGTTTTGTAATFATLGSGASETNQFELFTANNVPVTASAAPVLTAPLAASSGSNATPAPSGLTQPLTTNPAFPLTQSVIQIDGNGIRPATQVQDGGGATFSVTKWNPSGPSDFTLSIPSLGVATSFSSASLLKGTSTVADSTVRLTSSNSSYVALGFWEKDVTTPNAVYLGAFMTGYQTPAGGMPTSGTATYSSTNNVAAVVSTYKSGQLSRGSVLGDGSFTANFGTGTLSGNFTKMFVINDNGAKIASQPWNDVSVSGSIAGNRFSGSTVAGAPSVASTYTLTSGATGRIDGGFFGPNAEQVAGIWSITDSSHVAIGVAVGMQH